MSGAALQGKSTEAGDRWRPAAFTLVELLVVIGLVALLSGALAFGLSRAHEPLARRAAVSLAASLVSATRAQAALVHEEVLLLVDTGDDPDTNPGFLRTFRMAVRQDAGWRFVGERVRLPPGTYLVPPRELAVPGVTFSTDWPARLHTYLLTPPEPSAPAGYQRIFGMRPSGDLSSGAGAFVIAAARRDPGQLIFAAPETVRGFLLSAYGIVTAVDDPVAFPEP
jgi:prepilin-type N-terminal cleavage/methylation domain-containing protein